MQIQDPRTGATVILSNSEAYHEDMKSFWAACPHERTERRRFKNRNGSTAAVEQCLTCGGRVGNPIGGVDHAALPAADEGLADAYVAARRKYRDEVAIRHIDAQANQDRDWRERYDAYLQSDEWRAKRELVLKRCGGICEGCGEAEATEVHHMTYRHVFEEFLFELKGLCGPCHSRWHGGGEQPWLDEDFEETFS